MLKISDDFFSISIISGTASREALGDAFQAHEVLSTREGWKSQLLTIKDWGMFLWFLDGF